MKQEDRIQTKSAKQTEPTNLTKKSGVKFTSTKVARPRSHSFPHIMCALIVMYVVAYITTNVPSLQNQFPAIFWYAKAYLNAVEIIARIGKLVLQGLADIIPFKGHKMFANWGTHIAQNWEGIKEAFRVFMNFLVA